MYYFTPNEWVFTTENSGKSMSFLIKDDEVWEKYKQIWDVMKNKLGIKFHSEPVHDKTYIKVKVREFDSKLKQYFWVMMCQKKICIIPCYFVMRIDKENHWQVYLEECKYRVKKNTDV